ncbi:hypothetical protein P3T76_006342 [Phytophthora citrophthora]|uniref:Uncharacterized protein n=1 Tax=Phytophthora citrophthora TaxID=4793 RepID=A0AAD9LM81_9STRA|nr:hypothetical protein P3T76_006342 [Phytophthora citrophthora]
MKVLYICAQTIEGSSGYPRATPELRKWLFPVESCTEENIAIGLVKAFKYSIENSSAQTSWKKLFEIDNRTADREMQLELSKVKLSSGEPQQKRQKFEDDTTPVLVVAIDEAHSLHNIKDSNSDNALHLLRRALDVVNKSATVRNTRGIAFAVVADTNSEVHEFVPALSEDPSSRPSATKNSVFFPPFILTETVDVMVDLSARIAGWSLTSISTNFGTSQNAPEKMKSRLSDEPAATASIANKRKMRATSSPVLPGSTTPLSSIIRNWGRIWASKADGVFFFVN